MKRLIKKCIGYALIFGFTLPAFAHQWTIYNGLPEPALVQLNVSAQVMRYVIPSGQSVVFNYNTWAGLNNILWCGGLCLTTIYAQPMSGTTMGPTTLGFLEDATFSKLLKDLPDVIKAIGDPENPTVWLKLLYDALAIIVIILEKLCTDNTFIITKNPRTGALHSITPKSS